MPAKLARDWVKVKDNALVEALTGRFDAHHADPKRERSGRSAAKVGTSGSKRALAAG